jgi:FHA domain-containing protein
MLEVYVLTFADEPFAQPLSAFIGRAGVTIGRSSECVLHLPDPERHISRVQAKVESDEAGALRVSNVSNANSIFVGEREIGPGESGTLVLTDLLRVGLFTLAVREASRPTDTFSVSLAQAPLKTALGGKSVAEPLKAVEAPKIEIESTPARSISNVTSQNVSDPFLDLFPAEAEAKPAAATIPNKAAPAKPPNPPIEASNTPKALPQSMPTHIPEDFDPFAMPSAASRNTGDPFSALQDHKDVSLRGLLDDSSSANRLIDETPMKGNAPDFDPILGAETTGGAAGEVLDPLALFGARSGTTGFDDIVAAKPFGSLLDRPSSELNALTKFASSKAAPTFSQPTQPTKALVDPLAAFGRNLGDPIERVIADPTAAVAPVKESKPPIKETKVEPPQIVHSKPTAEIAKTLEATRPSVSKPEISVNAPSPSVSIKPSAQKEQELAAKTAADNEQLLQALLDGIGIPSLELQGGLEEATMRKIGEILRVSFDGTVEMMIARAMTKREVRTDVTMILAEKNNPIKFAPDGRAAIMQLLGKPFPGFMTHEDAIRDAYEDLRAHEVGVLAGMRAALKAVLNRFDPASLEKKITSKSSLESVLPHLRKAKLWDLYTEMSSQILAEAEDEFQSLFGKAFREVYEAEVEKVKQGRRRT